MSLRDFAVKQNRGNPVKTAGFNKRRQAFLTTLQKTLSVAVFYKKQSITTPAALAKNLIIFCWIATIFPTEKSRNDTGFIFRLPETIYRKRFMSDFLFLGMNKIAFFGALETGLIYALVALGVLISFRILDFPDLTADGSFPLGGAVCAVCIVSGFNPWLAVLIAMLAGAAAGLVTAWLNVSLKILHLLASILVMVALYSVNLRIMGAPNVPLLGEATVFSPFVTPENSFYMKALVIAAFVVVFKLLLDWFFSTEIGLSVRATGANQRMAQAQGIATRKMVVFGMALSNALIALGGALFVQIYGSADISIGVGTIVIGLAAVIIGETLMPTKRMIFITVSVIVGSILYRLFIQLALGNETLSDWGLKSQDVNLVTAVLVVIALVLPKLKSQVLKRKKIAASIQK